MVSVLALGLKVCVDSVVPIEGIMVAHLDRRKLHFIVWDDPKLSDDSGIEWSGWRLDSQLWNRALCLTETNLVVKRLLCSK